MSEIIRKEDVRELLKVDKIMLRIVCFSPALRRGHLQQPRFSIPPNGNHDLPSTETDIHAIGWVPCRQDLACF